MEADFSGYATKAGLKCSDGRTIMPDAFKHQDTMKVPLVWQHGHTDPENVLGHAILENRTDGVYAYGFFNDSVKAEHTRGLLKHGDINMLSIWANQLIERGGRVLHGAIREVSLVLSGANPGAIIDNVSIRHSDGDMMLDDEAVIYTGLELEHTSITQTKGNSTMTIDTNISHAAPMEVGADVTIQDVYDSLDDVQKEVVGFMIEAALEEQAGATMAQSGLDNDTIIEKLAELKEGLTMSHNIFEQAGAGNAKVISHADVQGVIDAAKKGGSFADAVNEFALVHNITNVDVLFPDAKSVLSQPELYSRRNGWVTNLMDGARKTPFGRIKSLAAELTYEQARAKGYIKGAFKKEEFFAVGKRVTTPTTVYKKQKLDRDDMVDITDFDVVAWLKAEMRMMLDEEIARAVLIGDGRDVGDSDKISESSIRPIATDNDLFTTSINVANAATATDIIDSIILNRRHYRGTGLPTMFCSESTISKFLTMREASGPALYPNIQALASTLRVADIIGCDALEDSPKILAIIVNPADYVMGADKGGAVSMFDNFDIDYNQQKYLIETRLSGALVKLKSALVVKRLDASITVLTPTAPTMNRIVGNADIWKITIPSLTGVQYKFATLTYATDGTPIYTEGSALTAGLQTALIAGDTKWVQATVTGSTYALATSADDLWQFNRPA